MAHRSRRATQEWLLGTGPLLRAVIVIFVAVLASGIVHAHQRDEAACAEADDCTDHEEGETPDCPEDLCGPAHHCGCCSPFVVTCTTPARVVASAARQIVRPHAASALASSGVRSRVERPPRS